MQKNSYCLPTSFNLHSQSEIVSVLASNNHLQQYYLENLFISMIFLVCNLKKLTIRVYSLSFHHNDAVIKI